MRTPAVYVACRVSALPEPHVASERLACARCQEAVWVDPERYTAVRTLAGSLRVCCVDCAAALEETR